MSMTDTTRDTKLKKRISLRAILDTAPDVETLDNITMILHSGHIKNYVNMLTLGYDFKTGMQRCKCIIRLNSGGEQIFYFSITQHEIPAFVELCMLFDKVNYHEET